MLFYMNDSLIFAITYLGLLVFCRRICILMYKALRTTATKLQ